MTDTGIPLDELTHKTLHPIHQAHVVTYRKLAGCRAGLLMNFNSIVLKSGLKRLDHPDLYVKNISS